MIKHIVCFKLKDNSKENKEKAKEALKVSRTMGRKLFQKEHLKKQFNIVNEEN